MTGPSQFWHLGKREAFQPLPRVLALLFLFLTGPAAAATLTGKADVVDADTIKIGGIPVRLYGIDAPESRQTCEQDGKSYACGKQATKTLADLIAGESVQCDIVGRDAFGRALGICSVAGTELNATMVSHGWALAFVKYSERYVADENAAESAKAGLWAGSFIKPWEWRFAEAEAAQETRTCVIKGNINREGARIYHLPSQYFYRRIKIDERKGERWFCTEEEAREAGWRRALR
jgi:endonuclease YncB( thermonuclease family)